MDPIHPNQAGLSELIELRRPLTTEELAPFGVEFVCSQERLAELRRQYGYPNAMDIGRGVFGVHVGLIFVDDDDGRVIAYASPKVSVQSHEDALDKLAGERQEDDDLEEREAAEAHELLPPQVAAELPPLYATDGQGSDAIAHLKLFTPWSNWTWYASEYDPVERRCFGVVVGHVRELGHFSLPELEEIRGPGGLRIERDLHWRPKPLKECC